MGADEERLASCRSRSRSRQRIPAGSTLSRTLPDAVGKSPPSRSRAVLKPTSGTDSSTDSFVLLKRNQADWFLKVRLRRFSLPTFSGLIPTRPRITARKVRLQGSRYTVKSLPCLQADDIPECLRTKSLPRSTSPRHGAHESDQAASVLPRRVPQLRVPYNFQ